MFRILRTSFFSGASAKIMFEDLPNVDRVLQLCLDIYLVCYWNYGIIYSKILNELCFQVRESLEFALEEDLFAKLIFLYRSPETMIKWTRTKNDPAPDNANDDDDDDNTRSIEDKKNSEY